MINHQLLNYNGNLYFLKRRYVELSVKPEKIHELKDLLQCDIVLRKDGYLLYCVLIPEAEIVE
jgi:hypothetical protein